MECTLRMKILTTQSMEVTLKMWLKKLKKREKEKKRVC